MDFAKTVKLGPNTYRIREAKLGDVATIAAHRERMFVEHSHVHAGNLAGMIAAFSAWLQRKLRDGRYVGWFAEFENRIVAGIGVFLVEWPPHPAHFGPLRGYVMNAFTEPVHRGRGIDEYLMRLATRRAQAERRDDAAHAVQSFAHLRQESLVTPGAAEISVEVGVSACRALAPTSSHRRSS